jgi:phospholipid/cholesterol/gamma-HCH transport system substrate-binding protein
MEIRARYVQMGAFTLAVIVAGFAFVYWLKNTGGLRERTTYRVQFDSPVSGLLQGSAVLFNGIRVGEVTGLELSGANPRQVLATIAVDRGTPVRKDTAAGIDFQGLTGSPVVSLTGGTSTEPLAAARGGPPLLIADPAASQSMSQSAREVLRRMDAVLAENAEPLRRMLGNLDTFSGALARNSDRLDGIVAGLERMTGGAAAKARTAIYDLALPRIPPAERKAAAAQLVVPDPTVLAALDSERMQSVTPAGVSAPIPDAQWSDTLSKLLQVKIIRAFEDSGAVGSVSRPLEGVTGDFQLLIDVRKFQLSLGPPLRAEIEFSAKVLDDKGRIAATRIFLARTPAKGSDAASARSALEEAFGGAVVDLLDWTTRTIGEEAAVPPPAPQRSAPKKTSR